jgi:hypothetical protein
MRSYVIFILVFSFNSSIWAQNLDWWDEIHEYPQAAGYFRYDYIQSGTGFLGPNALRVPDLYNGIINNNVSIDIRGEFHSGNGDKTQNAFLRVNFPIKKDRALFYLSSIPIEHWKVTIETRDERKMTEITGEGTSVGDIAFGFIYKIFDEQLKGSFNWTMRIHAKTTSGGGAKSARFTDGSMFLFDANFSKTFWQKSNTKLLVKLMLGFYTWQTNINWLPNGNKENQNDAPLFGGGLELFGENWKLDTDLSGYTGYVGNRDNPLFWRTNIEKEFKFGALALRYQMGLRNWDWNTFSINYRVNIIEIK